MCIRDSLSVVIPRGAAAATDAQDSAEREVWARLVSPGAVRLPLTTREHEVISLVAAGHQGGEIASRLGVSPETVKSHVQNAMSKLGVHTRAHAVAVALVSGQIRWEDD